MCFLPNYVYTNEIVLKNMQWTYYITYINQKEFGTIIWCTFKDVIKLQNARQIIVFFSFPLELYEIDSVKSLGNWVMKIVGIYTYVFCCHFLGDFVVDEFIDGCLYFSSYELKYYGLNTPAVSIFANLKSFFAYQNSSFNDFSINKRIIRIMYLSNLWVVYTHDIKDF